MKKLLLIIILLINSIIILAQDYYYNIYNDTTWNSDTIYINDNVTIYENATLSISPGTTIKFNGQYYIKVLGKLMAIGQLNDSILFTINDTTHLNDTSTILGGWKGIRLLDNINDTSVFDYCILEYGKAVKPGVQWWYTYNPANYGGAMYIDGYNCVRISNSKFRNNFARDKGGAIYADTMSYFTVNNSEFNLNIAKRYGGAIYSGNIDRVIISDNLFHWNECFMIRPGDALMSGVGGGIYLSNPLGNSIAKIINNKLFNNKSVSGIIYDAYPHSYVYNNILCNNYAITYFCGSPFSHSIFSNNIVANNLAFMGTAGIESASDYLLITNSIVWNNQVEIPGSSYGQIYGALNYEPIVLYNCVMDGYEGEGNIDSLPMFVNPTEGAGLAYNGVDADWSLLVESPCVNTGTPDTSGLFLPDYDIEGNPRICGFRIDMGAYENQVFALTKPVLQENIFTSVYPNPGQNNLFVKTGLKNSTFELIDFTGKILLKKFISAYSTEVNVSHLSKGIYFYRIYDNKNIYETGKWVKQ